MTDLISFERAVYRRSPDRVERMVAATLQLALGRLVEDEAKPQAPGDAARLQARFIAALASLLADPDVELTAGQMQRMAPIASAIAQLFGASAQGNADFILRAFAAGAAGLSAEELARRLPLLTLDSGIAWPPEFLLTLPPEVAQQVLAQLIGTKPVMTAVGQARKDRLLEFAPRLSPAGFPRTPDHLVLLTTAWMLCSYAGTPGKHAVKRLFNRTLREMAEGWGFVDTRFPPDRSIRDRPTLLFTAEIMHQAHVQYRYFGQYLRQLRARFELVLLTEQKETGPAVNELFDRVLTFRREGTGYLADIYCMIRDTAPDIIFWPSVGMRHWGPLFANLRLAPVQLTALGHSASTFCDTIDYYLLEDGYVSDPALFGETVVTVPDDSLIFERAPDYVPTPATIRQAPMPLRIALPSNILKLNPGFLAVVAQIRARAARPLEFHLFPNAHGLEQRSLARMVERHLPGARVHSAVPYPRYLQMLSACDLNLSPFPFGGLHSVIDSLRQGLPVVAMACPEPHGRTDAMLLRRLGMPDWLIAKDEAGYIAAALRVIGDNRLRVELSEQALGLDIDGRMFGDGSTPLRSEIGDAVWWMYRNHEAIQADGRKIWRIEDR